MYLSFASAKMGDSKGIEGGSDLGSKVLLTMTNLAESEVDAFTYKASALHDKED